MRLDLSQVLHEDEAVMPVSVDLTLDAGQIGGVVERVDGPFHVEGQIRNVSGALPFEGTITGRYTALCSRCNTEVSCEFSAAFSETIGAENGQEDVLLVENDGIEILNMVLSNIILNLPMRVLCKENCAGLCPVCGKNLNLEHCSCETSQVDSRFAVLESLLHKQSKED